MDTDGAVAVGNEALQAGQWAAARSAFESGLAVDETPEALVGLAEALRWLGETQAGINLRERAHTLFRRRGDAFGAALQAVELCIEYEASLGNRAAAAGWLARAERFVTEPAAQPLQGWVWLCASSHAGSTSAAIAMVERALTFGREQEDSDLEWCGLSTLGVLLASAGDVEGGLRCVDEAMAGALGGDRTELGTVVFTGCQMLTVCDLVADLERARLWCQAADEFVRKYGAPFLYAKCHTLYGRVLLATGRWAEAERELAKALTSTRDTFPAVYQLAAAALAELWLRQGRLDDAETLLVQVEDVSVRALPEALMHLRKGDPDTTIAILERSLRDGRGPLEASPALVLLADAFLAAGNAASAASTVERLETLEVATDDTHAHACMAFARGRLLHAQGKHDLAVASLNDAVARFTRLELPFDTARARIELAKALFEHHQEVAIIEARTALAVFDRLGASSDADIAAALLRTWGVGGRTGPRHRGVLSAREQEVLGLLAGGLSNQEIAERLYISRKTAAHHVSNVLSKLGVRNRTEAAAVAARTVEAEPST